MKKKLITTLLLIAIIMLASTTGVYANYQIKSTSSKASEYMTTYADGVRNMEASGQVMGLNETHDSSTLKATSDSNNIDVHLTKNTEFGAALLLSASPKYGKQGEGTNSYIDKQTSTGLATTTGNQYGVYEIGNSNWEWVAGGGTKASGTTNYLDKYYNRYDSSSNPKAGDATTETSGWKKAYEHVFATGSGVFARGINGAFSYDDGTRYSSQKFFGRASVVCGLGL